ncbi:Uncharacterised protein [Salmonella enterica subsp. enterica serovar Poona]|nr:Uncharacterised protein [Salmonella enterica subsp. enterica serovar Poona]
MAALEMAGRCLSGVFDVATRKQYQNFSFPLQWLIADSSLPRHPLGMFPDL